MSVTDDAVLMLCLGGMFLVCLWIILRPLNRTIAKLEEIEQGLRGITDAKAPPSPTIERE